jgi:hypothetical protein
MNQTDLNTLLDISKSKIDNGLNFKEIKEFIVSFHNKDIFLKLQDDIETYFNSKNKKLPNILLQPTGDNTKDDFKEGEYTSWAEKEDYEYIWEKSIGDTVLFIKNNFIFAIATIENIKEDYKTNKKYPLRYIWNDNIQFVNIPLDEFNIVVGYEPKFTPRKFMSIRQENLTDATNLINKYIK